MRGGSIRSTRREVATSDSSGSPAAHPGSPSVEQAPRPSSHAFPEIEFASPWRRLAAWVIDYVTVGIAAGVLATVLGDSDPFSRRLGSLLLTVWATYAVVLIHLFGRTLGRLALGIRVVNVIDGRPPSWNRSSIRMLILVGSLFVPFLLVVNCLRVLWDPYRRGWHDRAAQAIVVRARRRDASEAAPDAATPEGAPVTARRIPSPGPLSKPRRAQLIALAVVGSLALIGLIYAALSRYLEGDLIDVDFRTGAEPFEVGEDPIAIYEVVDGMYRVTLKHAGAGLTLGNLRRGAYAVGVRAELVEVSDPEIHVGVGCIGDTAEGDGFVGYLFSVAPGGRFTLDRDLQTVREGSDGRIESLRRLSITCVPGTGGEVLVLGFANGIEVARFLDPLGHAGYTYAMLGVEGAPGTEVRFTSVWSRVPDERWDPEIPVDTSPVEVSLSPTPSPDPASAPEESDLPQTGTFRENGVFIRYPPQWGIREVRTPFGARWDVRWSVAASPVGDRFRHQEIRVISLTSGGALAEDVARSRLDTLAGGRGTIVGPTATSIAGLPAFEGRILGYQRYGRKFVVRLVMIVDGPTAYEISCQYGPGTTQVIDGCARVIESFRVTE